MTLDTSRPLTGVFTALITPFGSSGEVDAKALAALVERQIEGGVAGVVPCGTTGEAVTLDLDEHEEVVRITAEVARAAGRPVAVIAGCGSNDTKKSMELASRCQKAGADALLAVTPYYNKPPQAGLLYHFRLVAEGTGLPIMLYDIPGRTGLALDTETIVRLAEHPRIVAVKDAKGDFQATSWVRARCPIAVYSGDDAATLPLLSLGAVGVVGVTSHIAGPQMKGMVEAFDNGAPAQARDIHMRLMPAFTGLFRTQGVILTKAALGLKGLAVGPVRPPLVDATLDQVAQLKVDLAAAGL